MAELKIKADSGGGTVSFKGPSTTTSNAAVQLTLPVDDGAANQYLKTDGSGALSWATVASVGGANALELNDGVKANFGTDDDLQIWHDDSNAFISNNKGAFVIQDSHAGANAIIVRKAGEVELLHNNVLACETSANGLAFPSGKGIDFSATADGTIGGDGGGRSEVLDDYEYGRWTPTCKSDGTITSPYNCHYHKVGNRVWVCGFIRQFSNDSAGNSINIEGLPFAVEGYEWLTKSKAAGSCGTLYMDLAAHQSYANGGDHIEFQASSSGNWNMLKHSHINHANHLIMFDCTYLTS